METIQHNSEHINSFLTTSLNDIYNSIAVNNVNFDFENLSVNEILIEYLELIISKYNSSLKTLLTDEIMKLPNHETMINELFILFLKYSANKGIRDISVIFSCYCDYFDFQYNIIYCMFHEKLQNLLKKDLIRLIGNKEYSRLQSKYNIKKQFTLFDL